MISFCQLRPLMNSMGQVLKIYKTNMNVLYVIDHYTLYFVLTQILSNPKHWKYLVLFLSIVSCIVKKQFQCHNTYIKFSKFFGSTINSLYWWMDLFFHWQKILKTNEQLLSAKAYIGSHIGYISLHLAMFTRATV